jgi:hypothetical protein
MKILDEIRLASVFFLVGAALIFVAYLNKDVSFVDAFQCLLFLGGACGIIGYVRNQAGHGAG